jgi:hypothetical protein
VNRAQRRKLRRRKLNAVVLDGGPMDTVVVTKDAPCLRSDWYTTIPPHIIEERGLVSGRYVRTGEESARWEDNHA